MLFNSYQFLIFFPIVCLLYFVLPRKIRWIWLLVSSYFFYMCWNPLYAILIAVSTVLTYVCGRMVEKQPTVVRKKLAIALCLIVNLGILIYFKYTNFLIDSLNSILAGLGINAVPTLDIILPVGISFYTFQAIGYTIDVYRGEIKAERNLFKYALFVSFFPQLVAGPIERSKNLLTQVIEEPNRKLWDYRSVTQGLITMVWGFFLKMVISDRVSIMVDSVFDHYEEYGLVGLGIGAIAFSLQIYTDFSGYSTIAIGAAKVLGFELMENFNTPFLSRTTSELWRRWHISLSSWFRDYVYIPLGGNRKGKLRKYLNILITFLTSGLWHGADWTFIVWGGLNGLYQIIGDFLKPLKSRINDLFHTRTESAGYKVGQIIFTDFLFCFSFIFFRAESLSKAFHYISRMFLYRDWWSLFDGSVLLLGLDAKEMQILVISVMTLLIVSLIKFFKNKSLSEFLDGQWLVFRWVVIIALIVACVVYGCYGPDFNSAQFIYFQF